MADLAAAEPVDPHFRRSLIGVFSQHTDRLRADFAIEAVYLQANAVGLSATGVFQARKGEMMHAHAQLAEMLKRRVADQAVNEFADLDIHVLRRYLREDPAYDPAVLAVEAEADGGDFVVYVMVQHEQLAGHDQPVGRHVRQHAAEPSQLGGALALDAGVEHHRAKCGYYSRQIGVGDLGQFVVNDLTEHEVSELLQLQI